VDPIKALADQIYRERVLRARRMSAADKLLEGARLFDFACRITTEGIQNQHPDADEQRVREILFERIALARRLEEHR
jgi:hypothetical protein